ncbi:MAG: hypothetical protein WCX30_03330 [Candidatus Paceibacterota bacterium]|jgi:hypothetical protein|nr:hypothetical protein [bacterium]
MQHIWSVLCQKSSIDFETNLVSLFECIEDVSLVFNGTRSANDEKVVVPIEWQLVNYWVIEDEEKENYMDLKVDFFDPDRKCLNSYEKKIDIDKNLKRFRGRMNIRGFQITKSGRYYCRVSQKIDKGYTIVSELPIDVSISFNIQNQSLN